MYRRVSFRVRVGRTIQWIHHNGVTYCPLVRLRDADRAFSNITPEVTARFSFICFKCLKCTSLLLYLYEHIAVKYSQMILQTLAASLSVMSFFLFLTISSKQTNAIAFRAEEAVLENNKIETTCNRKVLWFFLVFLRQKLARS